MLHLLLLASPLVAPTAPVLEPPPPAAPVRAAAQDDVAQLLERGRALLAEGKPADAQKAFEAAVAARDDLGTNAWLWRSWIDQGRVNDATRALESSGWEGPGADYVFGYASYARAQEAMQGGGGNTTRLALMDTVVFLRACLEADEATFGDAWLPLAHAAYLAQDTENLELAVRAIGQAAQRAPEDSQVLYVQGLISFWQFNEARAAGEEEAAAAALDAAIAAYRASAAALPAEKANAARLAEIHLQEATCQLWAEDKAAAAKAYAAAMGWDPRVVDFSQLWNSLATPEDATPFLACLIDGDRQYVEHYGANDRGDATLLWWLGFGQYTAEQYAEADQSFAQVLVKWPQFMNSHWYQGLARYQQADYAGAAETWRAYADKNLEDCVNTVRAGGEVALGMVAFTQGKRAETGPRGAADAAALAEVLVALEPRAWRRWNDLGLFSRDAGEVLQRTSEKPADRRRAQEYFERAWAAYQQAIELAPEKPHLLNDAAVILHYYLDRDLDTAKSLYERSLEMATRQIDSGTLEGDDLNEARIAKRDAKDNLEKLAKGIKRDG